MIITESTIHIKKDSMSNDEIDTEMKKSPDSKHAIVTHEEEVSEEADDSVDKLKKEYAKLKAKTKSLKKDGKKIPEEHKRKMADLRVSLKGKGSWHESDVDESVESFKKQHINKGFKGKVVTSKDSILEWVEQIAKKKYSSLTFKKEIMEMVSNKVEAFETKRKNKAKIGHNGVPEFMTYDSISDVQTAPEPTTKPAEPVTKPGTRPRPKTPYQPGPGTNPKPKAMGDKKI